MKIAICTIITGNYMHYALALHDSLVQFKTDFDYAVFISSGTVDENLKDIIKQRNIKLYDENDFENNHIAENLKEKYYFAYHDAYRWGMKPVLINFLLQSYKKVIYLDSDLYFFNDFNFLFKKLDYSKVLLTPHWRTPYLNTEPSNFKLNFQDGIYNAGFIGASNGAENAMNWWAEMILYKCEVNRGEGFYVDQRYLDILPIHFEGVKHIKNKGCNVANWNNVICKRTKNDTGEVLINNKYPIVFIHFTNTMLKGIFFENDQLLLPYLEAYRDNLLKYSKVDIIADFHKKGKFKTSRSEEDFKIKSQNETGNIVNKTKKVLKRIYKKLK